MQPSEAAKSIVRELEGLLRPLGFTVRSRVFTRLVADVVHLVEVQASSDNSQAASSFTVNLGVWVPRLAPEYSASISGAHWRQRLGLLSPEHTDLWWRATDLEEARTIGKDIADRVERYGLPALAELTSVGSLAALWHSGRSPGLTSGQAQRYQELLRATVA